MRKTANIFQDLLMRAKSVPSFACPKMKALLLNPSCMCIGSALFGSPILSLASHPCRTQHAAMFAIVQLYAREILFVRATSFQSSVQMSWILTGQKPTSSRSPSPSCSTATSTITHFALSLCDSSTHALLCLICLVGHDLLTLVALERRGAGWRCNSRSWVLIAT